MEVLIREERKLLNWKHKDKYSTENDSEKLQKHFLTKRRTKKLSTSGNSEFFILYIYILLQGIILGSLIPTTDAKLFPSHSSSKKIFHDDFTEGDKIFPQTNQDTTLGQKGQNITSQGKIFF